MASKRGKSKTQREAWARDNAEQKARAHRAKTQPALLAACKAGLSFVSCHRTDRSAEVSTQMSAAIAAAVAGGE